MIKPRSSAPPGSSRAGVLPPNDDRGLLEATDRRAPRRRGERSAPIIFEPRSAGIVDADQPIPLAGNFLDALAASGADIDRVAQQLGTSVAELEIGVPSRLIDQFAAKAFAGISNPLFGLAAGQRMDAERFGIVGFLAMTSATLGEAFERVCRFSRLNWWDICQLVEDGDTATVRLYPLNPGRSYGQAKLDMGLSSLVSFAERFTRQPIVPLRASLTRPRPAGAARYELVLHCPVEFGQEDSITFLRADLERRLVSSNVPLSLVLEQQAETALRRLVGSGIVEKVRAVVARLMHEEEPSVAAVATSLCLSIRTLQRRLAEEGVRYNDLVDQIRREAAEHHLASGRYSVVEVALLLGFEDPNSFYRAFKRWTGMTPTYFQRRALQARNVA